MSRNGQWKPRLHHNSQKYCVIEIYWLTWGNVGSMSTTILNSVCRARLEWWRSGNLKRTCGTKARQSTRFFMINWFPLQVLNISCRSSSWCKINLTWKLICHCLFGDCPHSFLTPQNQTSVYNRSREGHCDREVAIGTDQTNQTKYIRHGLAPPCWCLIIFHTRYNNLLWSPIQLRNFTNESISNLFQLDPSCIFSIPSLVRISVVSFPAVAWSKVSACPYYTKTITRWLESMNFTFSRCTPGI